MSSLDDPKVINKLKYRLSNPTPKEQINV